MNIYCRSDGKIFHVDPERIYQGSMGVNTVRFIGQFPSSAQVLVAYKLPNGNLTSPKVLTHVAEFEEIKTEDGGVFSVWETRIGAVPKIDDDGHPLTDRNGRLIYDLDKTITEYSGEASMQFYVYFATDRVSVGTQVYNSQGGMLTTEKVTFNIEQGVPAIMPSVSELTSTEAEVLIAEIFGIIGSHKQEFESLKTDLEGSIKEVDDLVEDIENKLAVGELTGPPGEAGPPGRDGVLKLIPVNELPTEDIDTEAMYLLRIADEGNRFQAYMYIEEEWEPFEQVELSADLREYVKFIDIGGGLLVDKDKVQVYTHNSYGLNVSGSGLLMIQMATSAEIEAQTSTFKPIVPSTVSKAVKEGIVNSTETWSDDTTDESGAVVKGDKTKARELIGAVGTTDMASAIYSNSTGKYEGIPGLFMFDGNSVGGIFKSTTTSGDGPNRFRISKALQAEIDARTVSNYYDYGISGANHCKPIVPANLDYAVMSALANSKDADGTIWTEERKVKACETIGAMRASDSSSLIKYEEWAFMLEDGKTITKLVAVKE